jgi:hypothetical protein
MVSDKLRSLEQKPMDMVGLAVEFSGLLEAGKDVGELWVQIISSRASQPESIRGFSVLEEEIVENESPTTTVTNSSM